MQRFWVVCTRCGSSVSQTFLGAKSIGYGNDCPTCGSNWKENQIIASSIGKSKSGILGDIRVADEKKPVQVIWLAT